MNERGQVLVEWAMIVALAVIVSAGAVKLVYGAMHDVNESACIKLACPDSYPISGGCDPGDPPPVCAP